MTPVFLDAYSDVGLPGGVSGKLPLLTVVFSLLLMPGSNERKGGNAVIWYILIEKG